MNGRIAELSVATMMIPSRSNRTMNRKTENLPVSRTYRQISASNEYRGSAMTGPRASARGFHQGIRLLAGGVEFQRLFQFPNGTGPVPGRQVRLPHHEAHAGIVRPPGNGTSIILQRLPERPPPLGNVPEVEKRLRVFRVDGEDGEHPVLGSPQVAILQQEEPQIVLGVY